MRIEGEVVHGDAIGRTLGFPTANIHMYDDAVPDGVWAARVRLRDGRVAPAVVSVGRRPTFCDTDATRLLEAHLIDFAESLYGEWVVVDLIGFIRDQVRFASIKELITAMDADLERARELTVQPSGDGEAAERGDAGGASAGGGGAEGDPAPETVAAATRVRTSVPGWALQRVRSATDPGASLAGSGPAAETVTDMSLRSGGSSAGLEANGSGPSAAQLSRQLGMSRGLVRRCLRELDEQREVLSFDR